MRNKYARTLTGQFEICPEVKVRSFTNEVMEYGHAAYQTTRLYVPGEQFGTTYKSLAPSCRDLLKKKKRFMTSHDLRWPFPVPLSISGTKIIIDEMFFYDTERIGWFWLAYTKQEAFQYFPIGLQCKGHESGLISGHRYKNSEIYKLHILVP